MFEQVLQEFKGLTNAEAYVKIFSQRMMQPVPGKLGEFFGTDQRIDFLPFLQKQIANLSPHSHIFDVGAGAGNIVNFAVKDAPEGTTIHIEEPNPTFIRSYLRTLKRYPHLKTGIAYEGPLQDYYTGNKVAQPPDQPQNLILAIHMIYHLTDFTQPHINAEKDLIDAITFLYGCLARNGSLFIVYADLLDHPRGEAVCGLGEKYFRHAYPKECFANNLLSIYKARNNLLGINGSIVDVLSKYDPKTIPILKSQRNESHFFGHTVADMGVLALAAELCSSDNQPFDIAKLEFCLDYINRYPERIGLQKEERDIPQKGLWRANEPQVIAIITKTPKFRSTSRGGP